MEKGGVHKIIRFAYGGNAGGQSYPLIIGDSPIAMKIDEPSKPPVFEAGTENDYFYTLLAGAKPEGDKKYPFANLMIRSKNLLEASYGIKTLEELTARKNEFLDLADHQGEKTIALVSSDCPVSMTMAVVKARELARRSTANPLIVAPLQGLSKKDLAMAKLNQGEKILFIDDETWFREQPATRPGLPLIFESE